MDIPSTKDLSRRLGILKSSIWKEVLYFKELSSTNDLGLELARKGYPEGTIIMAERQTRGKGRLGRPWISPEGGIYFSIILRPQVDPDSASLLTLLAGVACAMAIKRTLGLTVLLKWPNDLLINNKKVSGILTEMETELDRVKFVVSGIGVNANIETKQLPKRLDYPATSLMEELGREIDRWVLLREILLAIENLYLRFKLGDHISILEAYRELDGTFGRRVKIKTFRGILEGEAESIEDDGTLKLKLSNGRIERIRSGEIIL